MAPKQGKGDEKQSELVEVTVGRSDGQGYSTAMINLKSRSTKGGDISEPLKDTDESDHLRAWQIKLGKAVKFNLGGESDKTEYYVLLPSGYTLRTQHFTSRNRDDPFVFGHPLGPTEKFRSPSELALHILWLMSGSTSHADCSCPLCKRMMAQIETHQAAVKRVIGPTTLAPAASDAAESGGSNSSNTTTTTTATTTNLVSAPKPVAAAAAGQVVGGGGAGGSGTSTAAPSSSSQHLVPGVAATTTPPAAAAAAVGGGSDFFRPGEQVWYFNSAWRLGIVQEVLLLPAAGQQQQQQQQKGSDGSNNEYRISPLGHIFLHQQDVVKREAEMRPFLSFSVPPPIKDLHDGLDGKLYDDVDWPQLARAMRPEIVGLEASKLAAKKINGCFSLFNKGRAISSTQCTYGGVFLGAEQIRIDDALRVKPRDSTAAAPDILHVRAIYSNEGAVNFIGNIYRIAEVAGTGTGGEQQQQQQQQQQQPPPGPTFADEAALRQAITGRPWHWELREKDQVRKEEDVHGRFYVTDRLMALLDRAGFDLKREQGVVVDGSTHLNNRLQAAGLRYLGRMPNRATTVGAAISAPLVLGGGIVEDDGPVA